MIAMNHEDYQEAVRTAAKLRQLMQKHDITSAYGLGDVYAMQRRIDFLTAERDRLVHNIEAIRKIIS